MKNDKRSIYVWVIGLLTNIVAILGTTAYGLHAGGQTVVSYFDSIKGSSDFSLGMLAVYLSLSLVPAFIANSNFQKKNLLGFGIPILIILYATIHFFTCSGKFCNIVDIPIGFGGLVLALLFGLYILVLRSGTKFSLSVIGIQVVIIFCSIALILISYNSDIKLTKDLGDKSVDDQAAVSVCENIKDYKKAVTCWHQLVQVRQPKTNICYFAMADNYSTCFFEGIISTYSDYYNGKNSENFFGVCTDIAIQTMAKYGIKNTDEFMFSAVRPLGPNDNKYLSTALQIIRTCGYDTQPYKDLEQISRAYSDKYKPFCEVENFSLKNKCLQYLSQFDK